MKKLKNVLLPAAIILIGAGAAFATNAAKKLQSTVDGYYLDSSSGNCIRTSEKCSPIPGNTCTWVDDFGSIHNLRMLDDTSCPVQLSRP